MIGTTLEGILQSPIPCLGLDIDDTITADPSTFGRISTSVLAAGGRVVIITSRSEQARSETMSELAVYGIRFDALYFLPSMDAGAASCPHTDLNWFERYLWHKVRIAHECGVTHFIDDDQRVIELFRRHAPEIEAIAFARAASL